MESKELTLKDLIQKVIENARFLLQKWKLIVLLGLIGGGIGIIISIRKKPYYTATLKFVVEEEDKGGGGLASMASSFGFGVLGSSGTLYSSSNIIEFLKTRSMVEEALLRSIREKKFSRMTYAELYIKEFGIRKNLYSNSKLKKIKYIVGQDRSKFTREKDSVLGVIYSGIIDKGMLSVQQPNEEISIIQVDVKSENEVFSKNFAMELMDVVSEHYLLSKTQKNQASVDVLKHQTDSVKAELYASMGAAASASDAVFGLNPAMNVQRVSSSKQQAQVQMNAAVLQEFVKNLELAKMKLMDETPVIKIIDNPIYPLKKEKLSIIKGVVIGGVLAFAITIFFLLLFRYVKTLLK